MFDEVLVSRDFEKDLRQLPTQKQEIIARKITFLAHNPHHSSLNAHRLWRVEDDIWECYIDQGHHATRLLYEIQGRNLLLWRLGNHDIVDRAHMLNFASTAQFQHWKLPADQVLAAIVEPSIPAYRDAQSYAQAIPLADNAAQGTNYRTAPSNPCL